MHTYIYIHDMYAHVRTYMGTYIHKNSIRKYYVCLVTAIVHYVHTTAKQTKHKTSDKFCNVETVI